MTTDASKKLHDGAEYTEKISNHLIDLNEALQELGAQFEEISSVTEEQAASTDEVAHKNHSISEAVEEGEEIIRRTGEAVYTLSKMIDHFRITAVSNNMKMSQEDLLQLAITNHLLWR